VRWKAMVSLQCTESGITQVLQNDQSDMETNFKNKQRIQLDYAQLGRKNVYKLKGRKKQLLEYNIKMVLGPKVKEN
jgi:hypothetical protein